MTGQPWDDARSPSARRRSSRAAIRERELTATDVVDAHIERHRQLAPRINAIVADRFEARAAPRPPLPTSGSRVSCAGRRRCRRCSACRSRSRSRSRLRGMPQSTGLVARRDYRARRDRTAGAAADRRRRDPARRHQHLGADAVDRVRPTASTGAPTTRTTRVAPPAARPAARARRSAPAASPFGVGSDIGGSIRIPAFFCGVFGHKPSPGLIPNTGHVAADRRAARRMLAVGPLARRAEDLMPLLRSWPARTARRVRDADDARRSRRRVDRGPARW